MAAASDTSDATLTNETEGSALPERSVIDIVTDGDLLLDVGGDEESESSQPQRFRVSSSALSRHSPVWKNMLFGPWRESKQVNAESEQWIVELPGDPLKPMQIVLGIIHNRFSHVPPFLSLDELYKLLILTNKYDMTDLLKLWRAQWTSVAHGDLSSADTLKSLFIAWELGDANLFILRVEEISLNANFENETLFGTRKTSFRKSILAGAPVAGDAEWIDLEHQDYLGPHDMVGTFNVYVPHRNYSRLAQMLIFHRYNRCSSEGSAFDDYDAPYRGLFNTPIFELSNGLFWPSPIRCAQCIRKRVSGPLRCSHPGRSHDSHRQQVHEHDHAPLRYGKRCAGGIPRVPKNRKDRGLACTSAVLLERKVCDPQRDDSKWSLRSRSEAPQAVAQEAFI